MRCLFTALFVSLIAPFALAQQVPFRPPQLMAGENEKDRKPLSLAKADVHVVITGYVAQTTMTLTFRNELNRVLEGELIFPLPENATVSGYGLDVNGIMVDGVPVERQKARITYEKEIRRRVDPGLVEQAQGNNFRTRVYPIPANGARTIKVQYVSDVLERDDAATYRIPLDWGQVVGECNVKVEIIRGTAEPKIDGPHPMEFKRWEDRFVAEQQFKDQKLEADLVLALPPMPRQSVMVERRLRGGASVDDLVAGRGGIAGKEEFYFVISDRPDLPAAKRAAGKAPGRIGILWDASLSRADADKSREIGLVRALFAGLDPNGAVDIVAFRDVPEAPVTFAASGGVEPLAKHLQGLIYDGGTNLSAVGAPDVVQSVQAIGPRNYDYWLLFTDGLTNLGKEGMGKALAPVYAVSNDVRSNPALLRRIAGQSGGAYFNLQRASDADVIDGIRQTAYSLVGVEYVASQVDEIYPKGSVPVTGRVMVSGKLLTPEATLTLKYGYGGAVVSTRQVTVRSAGATQTGLLSRFWAQQKVADLTADAELNAAALAEVGREFSLVTPNTSLMVLETVEQYLEHRIVPPKTYQPVYDQFMARIEQQKQQQQRTREEQVARVLGYWNARVQWWEADYKYAKDFRYVEPPAARDGGGQGGGVGGHPGFFGSRRAATDAPAALAPAAMPAAPSPSDPHPTAAAAEERAAAPSEQRHDEMARNLNGNVTGLAVDALKNAKSDGKTGESGPAIAIKPWDPDVPYLKAMREAGADNGYAVYLKQRKAYAASPAFYFDCADFLLRGGQRALGQRVLTCVAELKLDDAQMLRIVAHKLNQLADPAAREMAIDLFESILRIRPEEPQSYRDLALALCDRAEDALRTGTSDGEPRAMADFQRSLELLNKVVMSHWDRFDEIEVTALTEANRVWARVQALPHHEAVLNPLDARLMKNLDMDVRIVLTWDADMTDVDLWVTEPTGEKCFYGHNRTVIGGMLSKDFTQGYGPEEYCLRRLMPGTYKIQANYYGSSQTSLVGPATVQATVITNFGRPDEKRQYLTLRLAQAKDVVDVGTITLGAPGK